MAVSSCGFEPQLINSVILRPFLYDKKHPDHSKRQKVARAWAEISQEVGRSAEACKTRWRSLRDRFYTIYKMKSGTTENANEGTPPTWAFFSSLRFLLDFKEPQRTNYTDSLDDDGIEEPGATDGSDSRNSGIRLKEEPPDEPEQTMMDMQSLTYNHINDALPSPMSSTASDHSPASSPGPCSKKARKRQTGPNDRLLQAIDRIGTDMVAQHQQDSAVFARLNSKNSYPFLTYLGCLLDEFTEDEKDDLQFDILKLIHLKKKARYVNGSSK